MIPLGTLGPLPFVVRRCCAWLIDLMGGPCFCSVRVSIFMVIRPAIFTDIQPPWERGELTIIRL